jgi:hypothetical protein
VNVSEIVPWRRRVPPNSDPLIGGAIRAVLRLSCRSLGVLTLLPVMWRQNYVDIDSAQGRRRDPEQADGGPQGGGVA